MKTDEKLLERYRTRAQLAQELGLAELTLRQWEIVRKGPPVSRIGRQVLYSRAGTECWLRAQEEKRA
jgi:hypothetical protein